MRKLLLATIIIAAAAGAAFAQAGGPVTVADISRLAVAPTGIDGIGRAVVIVTDSNGNPINNAYLKLESTWGGDHFCESWGSTGTLGIFALNPIHMGSKLQLIVKAKGFASQKITVDPYSLGTPIHVTLTPKA